MKNVWCFLEGGKKIVADVYKRKVTHVVKQMTRGGDFYLAWQGELDDDNFFMVRVLDGVVFLSVSERECQLNSKFTVVAYVDDIKGFFNATNEIERLQNLVILKRNFIPEFTKTLTFEEIMGIFMWEYASPNVEVYESSLI